MGVNSKGESWSSVKEKMYEHIRVGNSTPLPQEDTERMTFPPLACDATSHFSSGLLFSRFLVLICSLNFNSHWQIVGL